MKLGRHRRGRKYRSIAFVLTGAVLVLGASPAQAMTGGASAFPSGDASESTLVEETFVFSGMRTAGATWYGPGLYGRHTACGQTLRPDTIGVAHKTLPCGTAVKFLYRGRSIVARVIDRGPYSRGNSWDLTNGARLALGFEGANRLRYAIGRPADG